MRFVAPDPGSSGGAASVGSRSMQTIVAGWAHEALLREVNLTPKPGLVDRRNSGSHRDMTYDTFMASATAIKPFFTAFFAMGATLIESPASAVLPAIRPIGIACEQAMFAATKNVNTHKGAIFSLGLFCAAAGRLVARDGATTRTTLCDEVAAISADLLGELTHTATPKTVGEKLFCHHGLTGIRGEAASGYTTVRNHALPLFDALIAEGHGEEIALLQSFVSLMAHNDDSNLFGRGGLEGMAHVRARAGEFLRNGGVLVPGGLETMARFDDELIARNLSPGGSADLLAVTWFLSRFAV